MITVVLDLLMTICVKGVNFCGSRIKATNYH